ncbi:hypothetical protein VE03_05614 [Pseudogymnoascus sp. 23342-1-I1]|nr:hypothetical protein VE03_05614 [Pseudogymnoascus sp. 23342-1-I1]
MNAADSRAHFQDAHYIEEPRSNCVSRKRKSEDDEENVQDTKGDTLKHLSKKAKIQDEKVVAANARSEPMIVEIVLSCTSEIRSPTNCFPNRATGLSPSIGPCIMLTELLHGNS